MYQSQLTKTLSQAAPKRVLPQLKKEDLQVIKSVGEIILAITAAAGIVTIAAIAPNLFQVLPIFYKKRGYRHRPTDEEIRQKLSKSFYYLKRSGYIRMKMEKGELKMWLTSLGKKKTTKLNFQRLIVARPKHWNRKWWQVAADIPTEDYKNAADMLRWKLKEMKFYPLQRTLWLYPFDPRKELDLIIRHYGIEKFVTVMEINRLDKSDERMVKSYFHKHNIF